MGGGSTLAAFRGVAANRALRRVQLAAVGSITGDFAYSVAIVVFAFEAGGATAVGIYSLAVTALAAAATPFASTLADRFDPVRVMAVSDLSRMVLMIAAAVAIASDAPLLVVFACTGASLLCSTPFRPALHALLPRVAASPDELTAANVVSSGIDGVAMFAGPALGGVLVATAGSATTLGVNAVTFAWSAVLLLGIGRAPAAKADTDGDEDEDAASRAGILGGFKVLWARPALRLLVSLVTLQVLVCGFLNVFVVVVALDLLDAGAGTVGALDAAAGVGGLVGAAIAAALVGRRLSVGFLVGLAFWGLPLAVIGLAPNRPVAMAAMAVLGVANAVLDVAAFTLLQRAVPQDVLGRVFGVQEALLIGAFGIGAGLAPALLAVTGVRPALIVVGAILPVAAVLSARRLMAIDDAAHAPAALALLRGVPFLAVLDDGVLEQLAASAFPVVAPAGTVVIREGDHGDRYYVVASGDLEAGSGTPIGPGDGFGEIALLRDVPRTTSVTAVTDATLFALERDVFLDAVTRTDDALRLADIVIAGRVR